MEIAFKIVFILSLITVINFIIQIIKTKYEVIKAFSRHNNKKIRLRDIK